MGRSPKANQRRLRRRQLHPARLWAKEVSLPRIWCHRMQPTPAVRAYISPTMWPSGSVNSATVVSGATSVSGMITRPPSSSTFRRVAAGSSVWT
jgi:hypothetical protein